MNQIRLHVPKVKFVDRKRGNVIFLRRPAPAADPARAFQALTHQLVMQKHRSGTLPAGVVEALLLGVGIEP